MNINNETVDCVLEQLNAYLDRQSHGKEPMAIVVHEFASRIAAALKRERENNK